MRQSVRIIGGIYRGKKLYFPSIEGLRPTPDRVKETLFNWLMQDIRGAVCLDAFAGSGALGFEAFSRGAEQVVMVESSAIAYSALQQTALTFDTSKLHVQKNNVLEYLKKTNLQFDLVFLDPPFASNLLIECLEELEINNCLKQGGLVYIESSNKITLDLMRWHERKSKKAGQVFYALFEKR